MDTDRLLSIFRDIIRDAEPELAHIDHTANYVMSDGRFVGTDERNIAIKEYRVALDLLVNSLEESIKQQSK